MKELDRSGELLALCYRQQWEKAKKILEEEIVTVTTVASALHQAVLDNREETALFLLQNAKSELLNINTSMQKDGKTLLHLALGNSNLRVIRALLVAGADVAVPDKKSVKPMDIMTWTAVTHPTIMVPLQDDLLHLQQRNESQRHRIKALDEATACVECKANTLMEQAHETEEDVAAAHAFREDVDAQIRRAQHADRELSVQIQAEDKKLRWIRGEVERLHTQNVSADLEVAEINKEMHRLMDRSAALREVHTRHQQARADVARQIAIKCETIQMLRQFLDNEALQTRSLRALVVMCRKPTVLHQLLVNGLQDVLLEILERFPGREEIHLSVCKLISHLSTTANSLEMIKPWRTKELVKLLLDSLDAMKVKASFDEICQSTSELLNCLKSKPQLTDIDMIALVEIIQAAERHLIDAHATY